MKLYRNLAFVLSFSLLILVIATSCEKKKSFKEENAQTSVDVRMFQGQTDEALAEINEAIMGQPLLRGKGTELSESMLEPICGLDQDTSLVYKGIIRLIYNGLECRGVSRTGTVSVTIQEYPIKKWKNAGTILKIDFLAYKAIWASDGRAVQIDGTAFLTNESGKTWYDLQYLNVANVVQILTGEKLKATFSAENTVDFNLNRRMEYSYNSSADATECKIDGLGSSNGQTSLENWGINREGLNFTSKVISQINWKTSCGALAPLNGELLIDIDEKEHDLDCFFSVDQNGIEVSTDSPCPYGMQVKWSYKNKTNTRIFSYN